MNPRRTFVPLGLAALLAAGAVGALVAARPPGMEDGSTQSVAGWEIGGEGGFQTMTRGIGPGRIEYHIWGGSHAAPFTEQFRVESQTILGSCADEEDVPVGDRPEARRAGEISARIERKLATMDRTCLLQPAQNAALIRGFEAAYAVLAARFERARTQMDTSPDREQIDAEARMHTSINMDMAADTNMVMVDVNAVDVDADMNVAMDPAEGAANAAEAARPKAPRGGASQRP